MYESLGTVGTLASAKSWAGAGAILRTQALDEAYYHCFRRDVDPAPRADRQLKAAVQNLSKRPSRPEPGRDAI